MTKFLLPTVPGIPATASLDIQGDSAADVLAALAANAPFPSRTLDIGEISADFSGKTDQPISTDLGKITLTASANVRLAIAVVDNVTDLLKMLQLPKGEELPLIDGDGRRFAVVVSGYSVETALSGSHPVGALGKVSFGVDGKRAQTFAAMLSFDPAEPSMDVLTRLIRAWRLPAAIAGPGDLPSGALVLIEADGTVAASIGTQLGYDFSWVRELEQGKLAGDIGLKITAAVSAKLGFSASGRYLVVVHRPSNLPALRLRLHKMSKKGWSFAGNLTVGVQGVIEPLPEEFDEFVEAVFGVHGKQVMTDLAVLEKWTDPNKPPADLLAEFTRTRVLDLIGDGTVAKYKKLHADFVKTVKSWRALPEKTSTWLWTFLRKSKIEDQKSVSDSLLALADQNPAVLRSTVARLIGERTPLNESIVALLSGVVSNSVLELLDESRASEIRSVAQLAGELLEGKYLVKLQKKIAAALSLDKLVKASSWENVDEWLKERLSDFFGQTLGVEHFEVLRTAIGRLLADRSKLYDAAREALTRKYESSLAYKYQRTTAREALLDATFDFAEATAERAFKEIVATGDYSALLTTAIRGVTLESGALSHGIERSTSLQFTLPRVSGKIETLTRSLAELEVKSEGATLVGAYTLNASDEAKSIGRYLSRVTLGLAFQATTAADDRLRIHGMQSGSWTYSSRLVRENATVRETRQLLEPIRAGYFEAVFPDGSDGLTDWVMAVDRAVEEKIGNGINELGDLLIEFDVAAPAELLRPWFELKPSALGAAKNRVSLALQRAVRDYFWSIFSADLDVFEAILSDKVASMLTYAALPQLTDFVVDDETPEPTGQPYWDVFNPKLLRAVTRAQDTLDRMNDLLGTVRTRLEATGKQSLAKSYAPHAAVPHIKRAMPDFQGPLQGFHALLFVESIIVGQAMAALEKMAGFIAAAGADKPEPRLALEALAEFGEAVTRGFHGNLKSLFLPAATSRALGTKLLAVASEAIGGQPVSPNGLLVVKVLQEDREFAIADFPAGKNPKSSDVALVQLLASVA